MRQRSRLCCCTIQVSEVVVNKQRVSEVPSQGERAQHLKLHGFRLSIQPFCDENSDAIKQEVSECEQSSKSTERAKDEQRN